MGKMRRLLCLLLALLLLCIGAPQRAEAVKTLYFTAVDDMLLELDDETMPFWSDGRLYVAYTAISATNLGISCSRSQDKKTIILYRQRDALVFDLGAGTITDGDGNACEGAAILRGNMAFLPVGVICSYFGLVQSYSRTNYGYLVRIKSSMSVLPDITFIDAASSRMEQSYNQYMRLHEQSGESGQSDNNDKLATNARRTAFVMIEAANEEHVRQILGFLNGRDERVTFVFTPERIRSAGDLVRQAAASGHAIALRADASAGADAALAYIEEGNRELWRCVNGKTRLIYLAGTGEEAAEELSEAGYCVIDCTLRFDQQISGASRGSQILAAADRRGGSCCVYLAEQGEASGTLGLLGYLRNVRCALVRLTELTA